MSITLTNVNRSPSLIGHYVWNTGDTYQMELYFANPDHKLAPMAVVNPVWSDDNDWDRSVLQRCRSLKNPNWVCSRYIWPQHAVSGDVEVGHGGYIFQSTFEEAMGENFEDYYVHTGHQDVHNRWTINQDEYHMIKFANPTVMDFLFGPSGSNGVGGWVFDITQPQPGGLHKQTYHGGAIEDPLTIYFHDMAIFSYCSAYIGEDTEELSYATPEAIIENWRIYLQAFYERVIQPNNLKIIFNTMTRNNIDNFSTLIPWMDGVFFERTFTKNTQWYAPLSGLVDLTSMLNCCKLFQDAGKIVCHRPGNINPDTSITTYTDDFTWAFRLQNADVVPRTYTVVGHFLTLEESGDDLVIDLTNYTTIESIVDYINDTSVAWNADHYGDDPNAQACTWFTKSVPILRSISPESVPSGSWTVFMDGSEVGKAYSPRLATPSRPNWLLAFAVPLLAGVRSTSKVYTEIALNSVVSDLSPVSDLHYLVPLLGDVIGDIWLAVSTLGGDYAAWGNVYYREYDNGVVFLNWENLGTTSRVISAGDFTDNGWYPCWDDGGCPDHIYVNGATWTSQTDVTLPPKHCEICLYDMG